MDVNSFLGALSAPVKPSVTEGRRIAGGPAGAVVEGATTGSDGFDSPVAPSATEEPSDATTDITPSGIEVLYQSKPKRLYRVRDAEGPRDWDEVPTIPSVTTVLNVLAKDALVWWGQKMGVQGVLDLLDLGVLSAAFDWDTDVERLMIAEAYATEPLITAALTEHKLTVNHRKDSAASRGTNVHDALEAWGITGELPSPGDFPESESGYVAGLVGFLEDVRPTPERQEVMVGSLIHGFAGRFDLVIRVDEEREFTSRCYPKRGDKRETLPAGSYLVDAKTAKGCYPSHHLQLAAYELASIECGYPSTDDRYILRLDAAGKYEFVKGQGTSDGFLAIRAAHAALQELPA